MVLSEQSLVKDIRTRCLEHDCSAFVAKLRTWQYSRPHPLHIVPPVFLCFCKDHEEIGVKDVPAPHTRGSAQSETLQREEKKTYNRLFSCIICCTRVSFTSEEGPQDREGLARSTAAPLTLFSP